MAIITSAYNSRNHHNTWAEMLWWLSFSQIIIQNQNYCYYKTRAGEWYDLLQYPVFNMEHFVIAFCGELLLHEMMTFCQTMLFLLPSCVIYAAFTCILEINTTANPGNLKLILLLQSFGFLYKYIELRL